MIVWCSFQILYRVSAMEIIKLKKRTHNIAIEKEIKFSWICEPKTFRLLEQNYDEHRKKHEEEKQNYRSKRLWCISKMLAKKSKCIRLVGQCYFSVHKMEWRMAIVCIVASKSHCAVCANTGPIQMCTFWFRKSALEHSFETRTCVYSVKKTFKVRTHIVEARHD